LRKVWIAGRNKTAANAGVPIRDAPRQVSAANASNITLRAENFPDVASRRMPRKRMIVRSNISPGWWRQKKFERPETFIRELLLP
jgi:hypothetical protein